MRPLGSTLSKLALDRRTVTEAIAKAAAQVGIPAGMGEAPASLAPVAGFGANPGGLAMLTYVPDALAPAPALVVVLHGCGQNAAGYDRGAGWSRLADRHGFVLLFPEQSRTNNAQGCFNWFRPEDTRRGAGEAGSIREMIEHAVRRHGINRGRIFVTGLSAGGAMAAAMLAAYPDVFAGGAVIAGLPYGAASNVQEALESMSRIRVRPAGEWGDQVRSASRHPGPWPRLSVWHGEADTVVRNANAAELVKQWADLHGLPAAPTRREQVDGQLREVWCDGAGREVVESFTIAGMGHGTPLSVGAGDRQGGSAAAFMLDVGISSSHHIVSFWGLSDDRPQGAKSAQTGVTPLEGEVIAPDASQQPARGEPDLVDAILGGSHLSKETRAVIGNAFKAAGLIKP